MRGKNIKLIYFSLGGSEVKEFNVQWKNVVAMSVATMCILGLVIAGILALFTDFYKDIRNKNLSQQNKELDQQLTAMGEQIDLIQSQISSLEKTDNDMRIVLELPPLSDDIRKSGVGGTMSDLDFSFSTNRDVNYKAHQLKELLSEAERRIRLLGESRDMIGEENNSNIHRWNHTPSVRPVSDNSRITAPFGLRTHPVTGIYGPHQGIDFSGNRGDPVHATAAGRVLIVKNSYAKNQGYGREIVVDHGYGCKTRYAHLQRILVKPGQEIDRFTTIGLIGDTGRTTGPHLHYEVIVDGKPVNPVDHIYEF